jgi:uncharacterized membrane protein
MYVMGENAPPPRSLFERLLLRSYEYHHPRLFWGVRLVLGIVLLGVGIFVLSYGSWWGLPFLAVAAADFFVGYRIYQATRPASGVAPTRV